jgi:methionyl-tRNA formyltransferase
MQMDAGLDTGPVLMQSRIPIAPDDDAASLHDKLAPLGATMMLDALLEIEHGRARPVPQPAAGATYARKIEKGEARLDWSRPAVELERAVRAFNPAPGAGSVCQGEAIKIWRARVVPALGKPGAVVQAGPQLVIACGEGGLALDELQRAGGKRMAAGEFLRGRTLRPGEFLG